MKLEAKQRLQAAETGFRPSKKQAIAIADAHIKVHNALSKIYKDLFKQIGAQMWNADDCHPLKDVTRNAYIKGLTDKHQPSVDFYLKYVRELPFPLTVMDSYPKAHKYTGWLQSEIAKNRDKGLKWLNATIDQILAQK